MADLLIFSTWANEAYLLQLAVGVIAGAVILLFINLMLVMMYMSPMDDEKELDDELTRISAGDSDIDGASSGPVQGGDAEPQQEGGEEPGCRGKV